MDKQEFRDLLRRKIIILDGATGTELQKNGMPEGVCPEKWVLDNPEVLLRIQEEYFAAGANIVYTCTFGGNRIKLSEFGLGDRVVEINRELALISRKAAGENGLVAGDLAPTGRFIKPLGELEFEELVDIYKEQVRGLLEGGVDLFIIETMMDIYEARAAVIAVKESSSLPICVTMTFNENGRTLTGTGPETAVVTLQSLGADAVGCNCSTGPKKMLSFIEEMSKAATVPLIAKANAGLPKMIDGKTVFDMGAKEFGSHAKDFVVLGVCMIGGCCGTAPNYIMEVAAGVRDLTLKALQGGEISAVTSTRSTLFIDSDLIRELDTEEVVNINNNEDNDIFELALEKQDEGARILFVDLDCINNIKDIIESLGGSIFIPICFSATSHIKLESGLRFYPGRAMVKIKSRYDNQGLISSDTEKLIEISQKYGAIIV